MLSRDCLIQVLYFLPTDDILRFRLVCARYNEIVKQCYQFVIKKWESTLENIIYLQELQSCEQDYSQKQKFYKNNKLHEKDLQIIRKQLAGELDSHSLQTIKILCGYLNNGYLEDRFQDEQLECLYYLKHPNILKSILCLEENFEEITEKQIAILSESIKIDQERVKEDSFAIHICLIYLQNLFTLMNTPFYCSHRSIRNLQELRLNIISNVETLKGVIK